MLSKKIEKFYINEDVYDLETDNHHFSGGVGNVLLHNTDSCYIAFDDLVKKTCQGKTKLQTVKWLDKFCKEVFEPLIEKSFTELARYTNAYAQKMAMKREIIADRGIFVAKKRYMLNVWNQEGVQYKEPKPKISGLEAIKSSTPSFCRTKIKEAIRIILNGSEDELITYIDQVRKDFIQADFLDIAFPRGCNELQKYSNAVSIFGSKTPIHVRGALVYNHYVKDQDLEKEYPLIRSGEKIKFLYLTMPNPIRNNVVSFPDEFPLKLNLKPYVDHDLQFEKSFLAPLGIILKVVGWKTEQVNTLDDL
jgi:DNA polymerase elongation subunit (family B)